MIQSYCYHYNNMIGKIKIKLFHNILCMKNYTINAIIFGVITWIALFVFFQYDQQKNLIIKDEISQKLISFNEETVKKRVEDWITHEKKKNIEEFSKMILKDLYFTVDWINIKESYDTEEELINDENIIRTTKSKSDFYYNEYVGEVRTWTINKGVQSFYDWIVRISDKKLKELEKQRLYLKQVQKLSLSKPLYKKQYISMSVVKQKYRENTCMFNTLNFIMQYQFWKELSKSFIYSSINKKVGDFWDSWYFAYEPNFWWRWFEADWEIEIKSDFYKLKYYWIRTLISSNTIYINKQIESWKAWILEAPMSLFDDDKKWKTWKLSNVWHAVSIIDMNNNEITYADSLSGEFKSMPISKLLTWKKENTLQYPIRFIYFNNKEIVQNHDKIFVNQINRSLAMN